jgi:hypothetical protein
MFTDQQTSQTIGACCTVRPSLAEFYLLPILLYHRFPMDGQLALNLESVLQHWTQWTADTTPPGPVPLHLPSSIPYPNFFVPILSIPHPPSYSSLPADSPLSYLCHLLNFSPPFAVFFSLPLPLLLQLLFFIFTLPLLLPLFVLHLIT